MAACAAGQEDASVRQEKAFGHRNGIFHPVVTLYAGFQALNRLGVMHLDGGFPSAERRSVAQFQQV